ncbi:MAG: hypothetical protein JST93_20640 [Acidobacteria bacterium]|nr:hypothetical protein [Acidobacteriota bacterium]
MLAIIAVWMTSPAAFAKPCVSKAATVQISPLIVSRMPDGTQPELSVSFLNCTGKPLLLFFGPLTPAGYPISLRVVVTKPEHLLWDLPSAAFLRKDQLPAKPMLLPVASSLQTIRIPLAKYRMVDGTGTLDQFVPHRSSFSLQADVFDAACSAEPLSKLLPKECRLGTARSLFPLTVTIYDPPDEYPWLQNALESVRSLKAGTPRRQFAAMFHDEGYSAAGRFAHRSFPFIKTDVEFSSSGAAPESRLDQISKLSQPFVEFRLMEQ